MIGLHTRRVLNRTQSRESNMQTLIDTIHAIHPSLELDSANYSGYLVKRLARTDSLAIQQLGGQVHIAITQSQNFGRFFPIITSSQYLAGQQTYKRSTMTTLELQLLNANISALYDRCLNQFGTLGFTHHHEVTVESLAAWRSDLTGQDAISSTYIAHRRSRDGGGDVYNKFQLEIGDQALDGIEFRRFRRVVLPNDYMVFLRHRENPMAYSVLGIPAETANLPPTIFRQGQSFGGWPDEAYSENGFTIPIGSIVQKNGSPPVDTTDLRYPVGTEGPPLGTFFRLSEDLEQPILQAQPAVVDAFRPSRVRSEIRRVLRYTRQRLGQPQFRSSLRQRYGDRCMVSGFEIMVAVDAAHIMPYDGVETNHVTNGVLLRTDIHTLFDANLIRFQITDEQVVVEIDQSLADSDYYQYDGQVLILGESAEGPSHAAVLWRNENYMTELENAV